MLNPETAKKQMAAGVERTIGRRDIPVAPAPKPANKVEVGMRATLEDLMKDPSKYEGRAFKMVSTATYRAEGWGMIMPPRAPFIIKSITSQGDWTNVVNLNGMHVGDYMGYMGTFADKSVEVEEVAFDKEAFVVAEAAQLLRSANRGDYIGSDPEVFAEDGEGNLVPAFEFLGPADDSSKTAPNGDRGYSGMPFWDGYQAEFNTVPDTCLAYHTDAVRTGLVATQEALRRKYPKGKLSVKTTFDIPPERLLTDDKKYVNFGCTPSKSVYGEKFPDVDPASIPFRSAGGHLHFSMNKKFAKEAVKNLDRILGVISVPLFQYYDESRRRLLYGRAGEYRLPKYGIEYRTLSNAWMIHPATAHFVYEIGRRCVGLAEEEIVWADWNVDEDEVRKCINECDVELAKKILTENMFGLKALLTSLPTSGQGGTTGYVERWIEVIFNGVHTVLTNPDEYSNKWVLDEDWNNGPEWVEHSDGTCGNFSSTMHFWLNPRNKTGKID